jgi:hypothetical protein
MAESEQSKKGLAALDDEVLARIVEEGLDRDDAWSSEAQAAFRELARRSEAQ